ncbi:MAG TPA: FliH/SctL family protein [Pirellulales bacterium]|jgi:flagellar assembly protein FliH
MATVIKSSLTARSAQPIAFNFEDVAQHANRYVDDVQAKALAIIADAQQKADSVSRRAEEQGREAALKAVEQVLDQKVGKRMETLLPALEKVINELVDARQAWLQQWEQSAVHLAAKIAERVIRRELKHSPDITLELVREALEMASGSPRVKIALNPADFETLGSQVERLSKEIARAAQPEIVADESISLGGCRVETRQGAIDQQVETQLERIIAELTNGPMK